MKVKLKYRWREKGCERKSNFEKTKMENSLTAAALQSPLIAKVTKPRLLFFPSLGLSTKHFLIGPSSEKTFSSSPLVVSKGRLAT